MALPKSTETERTLYLQSIVRNSGEALIKWPAPNSEDVNLIGKVVIYYSYIDFDLRRFIEVLDHAKRLPAQWLGKTAKMPIGDIETILQTIPDWHPNNVHAFTLIKEFRKLRNLVAHFAVRRFPNDDALVFITKSAADYKRVLGAQPNPGMVMTGVIDLPQIRQVCRSIEGLLKWLSEATHQVENHYLNGPNPDVAE